MSDEIRIIIIKSQPEKKRSEIVARTTVDEDNETGILSVIRRELTDGYMVLINKVDRNLLEEDFDSRVAGGVA